MLAEYRRSARRVAALLLTAFASLAGATAAPHRDDCHDAFCAVSAETHHNAADHAIEGPPPTGEAPLHCIVCHWIRAFNPLLQSAQAAAPSTPDVAIVHAPFTGTPATFPAAQPPLRSPPAAPAAA